MSGDCEFLVRVRTKPDLNLVIRCGLTGRECFCEFNQLTCTRRTFALAYLEKHPTERPRPPGVTITD
jgi:hypothetical protein